MGRNKQLTDQEIFQINFFLGQKMSNREIARRLNRSAKVINNFVKNKENYGKNYKGRTKFATTPRERRMILRVASNSAKSARQIAAEIGTAASVSTVTRIIKKAAHLKRMKLKKKPALKQHHITERLLFAKKHMSWTDQWKKVIFSDEKKFNLDGPDGYNYYYHDLRKEEKILSCHQKSFGSVMVWAAISYHGTIDIVFLEGKQDSTKYIHLLENEYKKICAVVKSRKWIFQQDNAPIHTAQQVNEWFKTKKIEVLNWPANSPDLNIIENVFGQLSRKIYEGARQYENKQTLITGIKTAWKNIDLNFLHSLYDSLTDRIFDVIRNNGKNTKY